MAYILEKISPEDQQRIMNDVGEKNRRFMQVRSFWGEDGHVIDHVWAIDKDKDKDKDYYLMCAPFITAMSNRYWFYFYFKKEVYVLCIEGHASPLVEYYDRKPIREIYNEFKEEVSAAFSVHSLAGHHYIKELSFVPAFSENFIGE